MDSIATILLQTPQYLIFDNERFFYHGENHSTPMYVGFYLFEKKEIKDFYWFTKKEN